jgi:hypothetical protein
MASRLAVEGADGHDPNAACGEEDIIGTKEVQRCAVEKDAESVANLNRCDV